MLLCYLDESYTREHYYLATLICPEHQALQLTEALDAVVTEAVDRWPGIPTEAELHGYDILQGRGDWAALEKMVRARIWVYDRALAAIAAHAVQVVVEGIHPTSRLRERDPHSLLLSWTLERIDEYACASGELALVIADEPGQYDQQRQFRSDLGSYRRRGTRGWRSRRITRVVDTLHFAPSDSSRLVQASDLVAYLFHRLQTKADVDERAIRANNRLWAHLDPCVLQTPHIWEPGR